jgi:hypothetical protein
VLSDGVNITIKTLLNSTLGIKKKVIDDGRNGKRSLLKASSVGDFNTINNKFKEIYYRMFEQGKRFFGMESSNRTFSGIYRKKKSAITARFLNELFFIIIFIIQQLTLLA